MDPVEQTSKQEQEDTASIISKPERTVAATEIVVPVSSGRFYLLQYVTMLLSGLILLSLVTLTGYALVDQWLGDPKAGMAMFSDFSYYYYLCLLVGMVLFGGLHVWMRLRTTSIDADNQPAVAKGFLAVFIAILAVSIVGALGAIAYVGVDTLLGTGNYSTKEVWIVVLDALQVVLWSSLMWWHFKYSAGAKLYAIAAGVLVALAAILLVIFPIMARRDTVIDSRTSNDLTAIVSAVNKYVEKNNKLPASLRDVELNEKIASRVGTYEYEATTQESGTTPKVPQDDLFYEYGRPSGTTFSYKLCATFKTDTNKEDDDQPVFLSMMYGGSGMSKHPSGRHCFDQKAYGKAANGGDGSSSSPAQPSIDALLNSGMSF